LALLTCLHGQSPAGCRQSPTAQTCYACGLPNDPLLLHSATARATCTRGRIAC
jgi:hypothetical protein